MDFDGGTPAIADDNQQPILGTDTPPLYDGQRFGSATAGFSYAVPLPPGDYVVTLKFTENFATAAGQRVFDVSIDGDAVLSDFDIYNSSGAQWLALDETFQVGLGDAGAMAIGFTPGTAGDPKVDAIVITPEPPSTSGITFVQNTAGATTGTSSAAVTFPRATTAGNLLVVAVDFPSGQTVTLTDSQHNSFTFIEALPNPSAPVQAALYYAKNIVGGADTVTATTSGTGRIELYTHEYSGADPTAPLDASGHATSASAGTGDVPLMTTQANDLLFGYMWAFSTATAGSGFTARSSLDANVTEDRIAPVAGAHDIAASSSLGWILLGAAFSPK